MRADENCYTLSSGVAFLLLHVAQLTFHLPTIRLSEVT
jgi:hypothetical protein